MGLLDEVIGNVLGGALGGRRGGGHDAGGGLSPIVQAILMLLVGKVLQGGLGGGLGDILGGGRRGPAPGGMPDEEDESGPPPRWDRQGAPDDGPGGGPFGGGPFGGGPFGSGRRGESDFSDLAGGLDPVGGAAPDRYRGAGPYARPDQGDGGDEPEDGLGGLLERFRRGGYGDVLESWIGGGANRSIAPNQLADALGPQTVDALAQRTGMGRDALLGQLAQALPGVIDALTPHGRLPTADERRRW